MYWSLHVLSGGTHITMEQGRFYPGVNLGYSPLLEDFYPLFTLQCIDFFQCRKIFVLQVYIKTISGIYNRG